MIFDLHVHTNHSDGLYSPEKVVELGINNKLDGIAITDHDSISGLDIAIEYSREFGNFKVIPGIELSSVFMNEEVHILGYFIDYNNLNLIEISKKLKLSRISRGKEMVKKLNDIGYSISIEEIKQISNNGYIGRPHIARIMTQKGYVKSVSEAFDKYLNRGKAAYVERYKISIEETINLIRGCGGFSVLAHPGLLKNKNIIDYCILNGINGIECIHSKHSKEDTNNLLQIAKNNKLIITGGSDFHGDKEDNNSLLGKYYINIEKIPEFMRRI